jgi:predicted DNA-binding transcriptional regulator AlpA
VPRIDAVTEYTFTLKYRLPESEGDMDALVEKLGEAGCTDALVGIGIPGRLALEFTREADSAMEALRSALTDVRAAVPSATLVEAQPDFVGLTDVAELVGVSRQNMRKLMLAHRDFPLPVHEGSASLWHLADILAWLEDRKGYEPDRILRETAAAALEVNLAKEARRRGSQTAGDLGRLIA